MDPESLNLNTLASSLPSAHHRAEKDLADNFKAAALSITTLYRSSRQASKRAYNAGYAAACQDLLTMIQQGVSVGGMAPSDPQSSAGSEAMTVGRVMDWLDARMEAIRCQEEEDIEEEEKEREKERGRTTVPTAAPASKPSEAPKRQRSPTSSPILPRLKEQTTSTRSNALRPIQQQQQKAKTVNNTDTQSFNFDFASTASNAPAPAAENITIPLGSKRRHAVMMMLDSNPDSSSAPSTTTTNTTTSSHQPRRRTRSSRLGENMHMQQDSMDVEGDERERKRVARR